MGPRAYDDWVNLYDDNLIEVWHQEREELKKVSMILFILRKEMNRIEKEVGQDITAIRSSLEKRDELKNSNKSPVLSGVENIRRTEKENAGPLWTSTCVGIEPLENPEDLQSPEIFKIASPKATKLDTEKIAELETSPTIVKRRKRLFKHRSKPELSPAFLSAGRPDSKPILTPRKSSNKIDFLNNTGFKTPEFNREGEPLKDKLKGTFSNEIFEATVIDSTPVVRTTKKHSNKSNKGSLLKAKTSKNSLLTKSNLRQETLTQKYGPSQIDLSKSCKSGSDKTFANCDDFPSSMEIDQILKYVDKICDSSTSKTNPSKTSDSSRIEKDNKETVIDLVDSDEVTFIQEEKPQKFKVSSSFINNYDNFNKAPIEVPNLPYKEVVRGKERRNLKGWSCDDCKNYYESLNLPPEELEKKMDQCSKHRNRFKPSEKTYSGFWDMDMPDTETQADQSTIFHP